MCRRAVERTVVNYAVLGAASASEADHARVKATIAECVSLSRLHDFAGVLLALEKLMRSDMSTYDRLSLHVVRGQAKRALGRLAEAATEMEVAVSLCPDNWVAWLTRGSLRLEVGRGRHS